MAPERFSGEGDLGIDVYALACLLFECLTGSRPFPIDEPVELMTAHLTWTPPTPSRSVPGLDPAFDALIASGLAKDPGKRPASAGELAAAARAALDAGAGRAVPSTPTTAQWRRSEAEPGTRRGAPPWRHPAVRRLRTDRGAHHGRARRERGPRGPGRRHDGPAARGAVVDDGWRPRPQPRPGVPAARPGRRCARAGPRGSRRRGAGPGARRAGRRRPAGRAGRARRRRGRPLPRGPHVRPAGPPAPGRVGGESGPVDPAPSADPAPSVSPDRRHTLRKALWIVLSVLLVALVVAGRRVRRGAPDARRRLNGGPAMDDVPTPRPPLPRGDRTLTPSSGKGGRAAMSTRGGPAHPWSHTGTTTAKPRRS